jgi:Xaa-Pro aminopeptidase
MGAVSGHMQSQRSAHIEVQAAAKRVLSILGPTITEADTERSIALRAQALMEQQGIRDTWYHKCPALVLLGSRSTLSVSGRAYVPSEEPVGSFNLVTVDVSPCRDGVWGDCARSYAIENGKFSASPASEEFRAGFTMEQAMHDLMKSEVTPETTFAQLHALASTLLLASGYENLDFNLNYGHSIVTRLEDRIYTSEDNHAPLGSVEYFTFEPHIRRVGSGWGFKHEDIYYFDSYRRACAL